MQLDPELRARAIRSNARTRWIFAALALAIPLTLRHFFERNNGRLRALADHGVIAAATVTEIAHQGGAAYTHYAYEVSGQSYEWNVSEADAPFAPGQSFDVRYLPEVPSFSRPADSYPPERLLSEIRLGFQHGMLGGIFAFFALAAVYTEVSLRRLRRDTWQPTRVSPEAAGRVTAGLILAAMLATELDPKVVHVQALAFGAAPFGLPVSWVVMAAEVVLFVPMFWVFAHVMRLVMARHAQGGSLSRAGVVMAVLLAEPELKRSRTIALAGFAYFVALIAGWIAFAAHKGI